MTLNQWLNAGCTFVGLIVILAVIFVEPPPKPRSQRRLRN